MVNAVREREVWRQYPDYDLIEASNLGRIRMKDRVVKGRNGSKRLYKGHVLKQWLDRNGYLFVNFRVNGKKVNLKVHRVVAITFISNPDNLPQVNHIDCDRTNNVVSNLEWCTSQYNMAYKERYGISAKEHTKVLRRPVIAVNPETSEVFWFESQCEAARQLGIDNSHINMVIKGKRHKTGGCWFCDANEKAVEKTREKFGYKIAKKVEELMRNEL